MDKYNVVIFQPRKSSGLVGALFINVWLINMVYDHDLGICPQCQFNELPWTD